MGSSPFQRKWKDPFRLVMRGKIIFLLEKDPKKTILPLIISLTG
jgi:hypothetical protein